MRNLTLGIALIFIVAACGGGGDDDGDATTTTAGSNGGQATTTTSNGGISSGPGSNTEFCDFDAEINDGLDTLFGLDAAAIEDRVQDILDRASQAVDAAPSEIEDAAMVLLDGFTGFAEFLSDINYDLINNQAAFTTDPRVLALDMPPYTDAAAEVEAYCGVVDDGVTAPTIPGTGITVPDSVPSAGGSNQVPDNFPDELVPPGVSNVESIDTPGAYSVTFMTDASFDEVVAFYTNAEGPPGSTLDIGTVKTAQWVPEAPVLTIIVQEENGSVTVFVAGAS